MEYVADRTRNPFDVDPPCERYVPGYGDADADFHVVGDRPGVHGGLDSGVPFADRPWSERFFGALSRGGLLGEVDPDSGHLPVRGTFLSYLYMCAAGEAGDGEGSDAPEDGDYAALEPYFDAELRAVTAHVLLPVGARATEHVFREYTSRRADDPVDVEALHATEVAGVGWLVMPVKEPAEWSDGDADRLVEALVALGQSDYRQTSDLGRFFPDGDPYLVR